MADVPMSLAERLREARACRLCAHELEPRPVLRLSTHSRILIIGQAPGSRVHASGEPWDDASGRRLVEWLGVDRATFDDPRHFGILPMAFCYPGKGESGDLPPPKRCAQTWHSPLTEVMPHVALTVLVGLHAQRYVLGRSRKRTLTETVRAWADYGPDRIPLPHPAWRSTSWMRKNPWFETDVLPVLRERVAALTAPDIAGART